MAPKSAGFSVKGLSALLSVQGVRNMTVGDLMGNLPGLMAQVEDDLVPARAGKSIIYRRFEAERSVLGAAAEVSRALSSGMLSTSADYSWDDAKRCLRAGVFLEADTPTTLSDYLMTALLVANAVLDDRGPMRTKEYGSWQRVKKLVLGITDGDIGNRSHDYAHAAVHIAEEYLASHKNGGRVFDTDEDKLKPIGIAKLKEFTYSKVNNPTEELVENVLLHGIRVDEVIVDPVIGATAIDEIHGPVETPPETQPKPLVLPDRLANISWHHAKMLLGGVAKHYGLAKGTPVQNALKVLDNDAAQTFYLSTARENLTSAAWKSIVLGMRVVDEESFPMGELVLHAPNRAAQGYLLFLHTMYKGGEQHDALMWALGRALAAFELAHPDTPVKNVTAHPFWLQCVMTAGMQPEEDGFPGGIADLEYEAGLLLGDLHATDAPEKEPVEEDGPTRDTDEAFLPLRPNAARSLRENLLTAQANLTEALRLNVQMLQALEELEL